ncbi:MAG TPA: GNAT family N-acetyltransferase [Polyangiaceae bacterium]|nr:GNAT family N-acetyltransferase [Polyangiaceae bacterium]
MLELRVLDQGDYPALEAFLSRHRDTSMFLRSNARQAGLVFAGQRLQATYVAGLRDGHVMGVAALCWNGMLLLQAPEGLEEIVARVVRETRTPLRGLSGPAAQVRTARSVLGLDAAPTSLEEDEELYALDLRSWTPPARLARDLRVECRAPLPSERTTLRAWRFDYEVESLGRDPDDLVARAQSDVWLDAQIDDDVAWVAVARGVAVSFSGFNATLPDIVQLGAVYTPPEYRGHGYARAAVAHSVRIAKERGATRAVLFTKNPSAVKSYEAVGFRHAGDFGLVLFA